MRKDKVTKWVAVNRPYGDYEIEGVFDTKRDALNHARLGWTGGSQRSEKVEAGKYEHGRYLIIRSDLFAESFPGETI